jgi:hypothetical protein
MVYFCDIQTPNGHEQAWLRKNKGEHPLFALLWGHREGWFNTSESRDSLLEVAGEYSEEELESMLPRGCCDIVFCRLELDHTAGYVAWDVEEISSRKVYRAPTRRERAGGSSNVCVQRGSRLGGRGHF